MGVTDIDANPSDLTVYAWSFCSNVIGARRVVTIVPRRSAALFAEEAREGLGLGVGRGGIDDQLHLAGGVLVAEALVGSDGGHGADAGQVDALPGAGGEVPGHDRVAAGGDDLAVVVAGAGEDAGGADLDVVAGDLIRGVARHEFGSGGGEPEQTAAAIKANVSERRDFIRTPYVGSASADR